MNNKNSLLLVDPEFDPQAASDCALLIRITTDSFSYAIFDKKINQLMVLFDCQESKDVINDLNSQFRSDSYLSLPFVQTKISVHTANSLAIPQDLYDDDYKDSYINCFRTETARVHTLSVPSHGLQLVYGLGHFADEQLNTLFPSASIFEHTVAALALTAGLEGNVLFLDFTVNSCNIIFQKSGQLVFSKHFETDDTGEFNYYLVLLIKQLSIVPAATQVYLSGIIHENDATYACVHKYFRQLQFFQPYQGAASFALLEDMPLHYYNSLLAIDLCG